MAHWVRYASYLCEVAQHICYQGFIWKKLFVITNMSAIAYIPLPKILLTSEPCMYGVGVTEWNVLSHYMFFSQISTSFIVYPLSIAHCISNTIFARDRFYKQNINVMPWHKVNQLVRVTSDQCHMIH